MSEKDSRDSFYFLNAYQDGITPGQKITIQHNVSYNDWRAAPHLAPLVKLTDAEINQRKEASITLEKELYAKLKQIASEWDEQAAHTMLLERALEYVHTPEVEHTANEWKERENGVWEISNRTYKMRYQITYAKATDIYLVSWGIIYNAPKQPNSKYANYWGDSIYVARQDKKKYPSMEAAQNYIQGRFDLYSHLFRELSPPIPTSANGCSASMAAWLPAIRWRRRTRKNPTSKLWMICWPVWMIPIPLCRRKYRKSRTSLLKKTPTERVKALSKRSTPRHGRTAALCVAVPASMEF